MENLWATTIDPDAALVEWLTAVGGSVPARLLTSRSSFRAFAAAAPGAKELVSLVKVWELTQSERWRKRGGRYDVVILDAPATGHALALLRSPATYGAIARVGPIAAQIRQVGDLLADPDRTGYVAVAQGSEMAITETLELAEGLERDMHRGLDTVIVNGTFPRRFRADELRRLATLENSNAIGAAARAALFVADRARLQHNQIARLRRQHLHVLAVPFIFQARLDPAALAQIADRLAQG
jgi:anion-transporting  ArsA/GET3 family ATPase